MTSRIFNYSGIQTTSVYENAGLPHDIAPPLYLCFEVFKSEESFKVFQNFVHSTKPSIEEIFDPNWLSMFILIPLNKLENLLGKRIIEQKFGKRDVLPTKLKLILRVATLTKLLRVVTEYGQDPVVASEFEENNKETYAFIKDKKNPCKTPMEVMLFMLPSLIEERLNDINPNAVTASMPEKGQGQPFKTGGGIDLDPELEEFWPDLPELDIEKIFRGPLDENKTFECQELARLTKKKGKKNR